MSAYVIAEAGSCHMGVYPRAERLIDVAESMGANAVKFQFWSSSTRMRERRHVGDPQAYTVGSIRPNWLIDLSAQAHALKLDFLCTVYLPEDIATVAPYVDKFKVSSFEAGDAEFIAAHRKYQKEIIVSTGMMDMIENEGVGLAGLSLLHCVSAYPCPVSQANLSGVTRLDGYSDHTRNVLTGAVAVGAGAQILEVHFRLDDTPETCPDYPVALSPKELQTYITNVRLAEQLMGDGVKRPQECEWANMKHRVVS